MVIAVFVWFENCMNKQFILFLTIAISGCAQDRFKAEIPQQLPMAITNNAVAFVAIDGDNQFYTFNGLTAGKTHQDITQAAFVWRKGQWQSLSVPTNQAPVLASTAVTVGDSVYLFGGYTVAEDHSEKSMPHVWEINARTHAWQAMPPMPTPVDDAVALVFEDRYIYIISGWHDVDNVKWVQVFDTQSKQWQLATDFPLPPVFGHAGGIIDNHMLICDGVKVEHQATGKTFLPSPACVIGSINKDDITDIKWQAVEHHSGTAYYRMAAASDQKSMFIMAGGSDNPYNYNGIGYNTKPSKPSQKIHLYDLENKRWQESQQLTSAVMDLRTLLVTPKHYVIMGGMSQNQQVSKHIITVKRASLFP